MASRRAQFGALGVVSALGGSGCLDPCANEASFASLPQPTPVPGEPPIVMSGEWIADDLLELQFSSALSVQEPLDTNRFALVGWAMIEAARRGECVISTNYHPRSFSRVRPEITAAWIDESDSTHLEIRITDAARLCWTTDPDWRPDTDISVEEGLMLVYTDAGSQGRLLSTNGDPVVDLGAQWAITSWDRCIGYDGYPPSYCNGQLAQLVAGHLPRLDTLPTIPCPS